MEPSSAPWDPCKAVNGLMDVHSPMVAMLLPSDFSDHCDVMKCDAMDVALFRVRAFLEESRRGEGRMLMVPSSFAGRWRPTFEVVRPCGISLEGQCTAYKVILRNLSLVVWSCGQPPYGSTAHRGTPGVSLLSLEGVHTWCSVVQCFVQQRTR